MAACGDAGQDSTGRLLSGVSRRIFRVAWIVNAVGGLVTFASVGFLIPVFFDPDEAGILGARNAPLLVLALVIGGYVLTRLSGKDQRRAFAWIAEGRDPTEAEHRLTLTLAATWTKRLAITWALAAVVFSLINITHTVGFAAVVLATIWLGGETTCALASDAALDRAAGDERGEWELTERTVLRGRLEATGLATPVDRAETRSSPL